MHKIYIHEYKSLVGELLLADFKGNILMIDWKYRKQRATIDARIKKHTQTDFVFAKTDLHTEVITQFTEYFNKKRTRFTIPLQFIGTEFQQEVWRNLQKIPYGKTASYQELAKQFTTKKAVRAVASANGMNAISILVPCHRIIGKNGNLVGYAGGLQAKKKLLQIEQSYQQISLFN